MSKRPLTIALAILTGIVVLIVVTALGSRDRWLDNLTKGAAESATHDTSIVAGKRLEYDLEVRANQSAPSLPAVSGTMAIRAKLVLDLMKLTQAGGSALFRLIPTTALAFFVLDTQLLSTNEATATITGKVAWGDRLALERLEVSGGVSQTQAALTLALFRQLFVADECTPGATRIDVELGLGVGHYALGVAGSGGRTRRLSAVQLSGPLSGSVPEQSLRRADGSIQCETGFPVTLLEDSSLVLLSEQRAELVTLENSLRLRLVRTGSGVHDEPPVPMRNVNLNATSTNQSLQSRAKGLTAEGIIADLKRFANAGRMLDTPRWMWQATARLTLEPQYLPAIGDLLRGTELADTGRAFVSDLLAFTPAPEAQDALRSALLQAPTGVDAVEHALLVQRFAFVSHPTVGTLTWLDTLRKAAPVQGPVFQAATLALGSGIGKPGVAEQVRSHFLDELLGELARSTDEELIACELRAIGNSALTAPLEAVRSRSSHASALVRAAVASALRHAKDSSSRDVLVSQVRDPAPFVVRHALHSLRLQPLTPANYRSLARDFQSLPQTLHDDAVSFLGARRVNGLALEETTLWRNLVAVLLQHVAANGALASRLSELLEP